MDQAYRAEAIRQWTCHSRHAMRRSRRGENGAAVHRLEATYLTPIEHHNPMEPHATIAAWDGDKLTVHTATQGISGARQTLAALFGIAGKRDGHLPLCRRRLRLQGQHMAARDTGRDGRPPREAAGEAGGHAPRRCSPPMATARAPFRNCGWPPTPRQAGTIRHDGFSQMSRPEIGEFTEAVGKSAPHALRLSEPRDVASASSASIRDCRPICARRVRRAVISRLNRQWMSWRRRCDRPA